MRNKLRWLIFSRLIIALVLLITLKIIDFGSASPSMIRAFGSVIGAMVVLSAIYFAAVSTPLSVKGQAYTQLIIDMVAVTWLVHQTGDVESPFPALYLVVIFAASTLFGRREVFVIASIGGALYIGNSVLKLTGVLTHSGGNAPGNSNWASSNEFLFALNLVAIFAIAALSSHLAERIRISQRDLEIATRDLADYRLFNDRIIESMRSGLVTTDLRGNITTFNRAAEEITGHRAQDVKGHSIYALFGDIDSQIEASLESIRTRTRLPRFDIGCKTASGAELHLGFSVAPLVDENQAPTAPTTRGYVLTFQDLTEVMELEREVRRQERLAALGKMAAGLAHEIRNPLASMRGSVQVLAGELALSPDQSQLMEIVLRESDRLNRIVSDFLVYARPPRIERTTIELSSILGETVALLRNSPELSENHKIVEEYGAENAHYNGDSNQIRQVFWNLARNAIQAMPRGGILRVALDATPGRDVTILFQDTGQGMTREQKERMFEPFNSSSGGTGLGMAIVYQLVRDHNGKIMIDSEAGKGTSISIKLPASGRVTGNLAAMSIPDRSSSQLPIRNAGA